MKKLQKKFIAESRRRKKQNEKCFCKSKAMRKNREILKWKNNMRALAMVICLALTMQFASGCGTTESAQSTQENATTIAETFDFAAVPAYDGKAYVAVNDNIPFFNRGRVEQCFL